MDNLSEWTLEITEINQDNLEEFFRLSDEEIEIQMCLIKSLISGHLVNELDMSSGQSYAEQGDNNNQELFAEKSKHSDIHHLKEELKEYLKDFKERVEKSQELKDFTIE